MAHDTAADVTASGSYTSELRVSLVLYGGSSLVMYMNGVAQELLRMVQATAGPRFRARPPADDPRFVGYDLAARISQHDVDTGYERLLTDDGGHRRSARAVLAVLGARSSRRRLTIDVLSGASAGGLNAIFLARALLMNGDVGEAERLLVEHGDVLTILNALLLVAVGARRGPGTGASRSPSRCHPWRPSRLPMQRLQPGRSRYITFRYLAARPFLGPRRRTRSQRSGWRSSQSPSALSSSTML